MEYFFVKCFWFGWEIGIWMGGVNNLEGLFGGEVS